MSLPIVDRAAGVWRENLLFLKETEKMLRAGKVISAAAEARELVTHFGRISRVDFFTGAAPLTVSAKKSVLRSIQRRITGLPLAYVTGSAGFYGHDLFVSRHTLVPRPETELLVEKTLEILERKGLQQPRLLDIGTGSGCLAVSLTIARPDCKMTALEISSQALKIARKNAVFHHVVSRIDFRQGDLFEGMGDEYLGFWDLIVSNPPYISSRQLKGLPREVRREPQVALDGGPDGLKTVLQILKQAPEYLKDGGYILLEIGKGQARVLAKKIAEMACYSDLKFYKDLTGIDRVLSVKKIGDEWTS